MAKHDVVDRADGRGEASCSSSRATTRRWAPDRCAARSSACIEDPLADFVLGRDLAPGSTLIVDRREEPLPRTSRPLRSVSSRERRSRPPSAGPPTSRSSTISPSGARRAVTRGSRRLREAAGIASTIRCRGRTIRHAKPSDYEANHRADQRLVERARDGADAAQAVLHPLRGDELRRPRPTTASSSGSCAGSSRRRPTTRRTSTSSASIRSGAGRVSGDVRSTNASSRRVRHERPHGRAVRHLTGERAVRRVPRVARVRGRAGRSRLRRPRRGPRASRQATELNPRRLRASTGWDGCRAAAQSRYAPAGDRRRRARRTRSSATIEPASVRLLTTATARTATAEPEDDRRPGHVRPTSRRRSTAGARRA